MTDVTQVQETNTSNQDAPVENNSTQQVNSYEAKAREQGWTPKEEWQGEPGKWRDAKEFVERGELFGKIDTMGRELKETKKALKMLQEHHTKVRETEYNRAISELKSLQKKHLEEGNSDGYLETSELLTDLKAEQKARQVAAQMIPQQQGVDPRFVQWQSENQWYNSNQEMREYADSVGLGYAQRNPGVDPQDVLEYVAKQVKRTYKEAFQNANRTKPNAVEGDSAPSGKRTTSFELTDDERRVMNTFVRSGVLSKEQYIEEVKRLRNK